MATIYNILLNIIDRLPQFITLIPYLFLRFLVILSIKSPVINVWVRNSLKENNIVPGLSDLDFTFYLTGKIMKQENQKIVSRYQLLHRLFPLLGEINVYDSEEAAFFAPLANPLELKRDPEFVEKLSQKVRPQSKESDLVFIVHMLLSDMENLKKRFPLRKRKWKRHLKNLSTPIELVGIHNLDSFLDLLDKELFSQFPKNEFKRFLKKYIQTPLKTQKDINRFYEGVIHLKSFVLLTPSQWIGASLDAGEFEMDCQMIKNFSQSEQLIFIEQMNWEVWGLFSQYRVTMEEANLHIHLGNLETALKAVQDVDTSDLKERMKRLSSLQETYFLQ